jgi:hypothetical protein
MAGTLIIKRGILADPDEKGKRKNVYQSKSCKIFVLKYVKMNRLTFHRVITRSKN